MRMMIASLALAISLALVGPARAQVTIDWQENGLGNLGLTSSFTASGLTVEVTAYTGGGVNQSNYGKLTGTWSPTTGGGNDLYAKNGGGSGNSSETGLGLTSDGSGDHEITYGYGIKIDFSQVKLDQPYTITFGSVQSGSGDKAGIYDLSTGNLVGLVDSGGSTDSVTIGPGTTDFQYLITEVAKPSRSDTDPNILLGSIALTAAPEPSTMAIAGLGALGMIGYALRRRTALGA
jgi:hypothetical protein